MKRVCIFMVVMSLLMVIPAAFAESMPQKQVVVLAENTYIYWKIQEKEENVIAAREAGDELTYLEIIQGWDGSIWYTVELQEGIGYLPERFAYVKEAESAAESIEVEEDWFLGEEEASQEEEQESDILYAASNTRVYADSTETIFLGRLTEGQAVQVLGIEGKCTIIAFNYNGTWVPGYVRSADLTASVG